MGVGAGMINPQGYLVHTAGKHDEFSTLFMVKNQRYNVETAPQHVFFSLV